MPLQIMLRQEIQMYHRVGLCHHNGLFHHHYYYLPQQTEDDQHLFMHLC